jgi:prolyl-tRNA synthetase
MKASINEDKIEASSDTKNKGITKRAEDYSGWYADVIDAAGLAEHAPVRGCMIIKPYGYAIWELLQKNLDERLKSLGVQNAYFPIFIPESFLKREAEHVEGFSPELAVVTHGGGKKLEEPLVVRPTSETIIYEMFSKWIKSYRDLPLLINQWANVVRWELRPRLFLRTTEFLWQEGHTAHATAEEAEKYALMILFDVYQKFVEEYLAMPVYTGKKSEKEKFAGAKQTFCMEALMQDGKSLQAGTSHDLSDNFAKSFNVSFLDDQGETRNVFQTSWGVSTRLIGGVIMSHSDDAGLVLPPKIAPTQVIVIPILKEGDAVTIVKAQELLTQLKAVARTDIDIRDNLRPGEKYYEWEKKGVPIRIELGPKDLANNQCILVRRDTGEKIPTPLTDVVTRVLSLLDEIQTNLFDRAVARREASNQTAETWDNFQTAVDRGGYVFVHWCEETACELAIKEKTKAGTRCLPFISQAEAGGHDCIHCGKPSPTNRRWIFAKAY